MSISKIRNSMINDGNDIYFIYNDRESGIASTVHNSVFIFHAWYGADTKDFNSFDEMIRDKIFGGKSIIDLVDIVDIGFC